MCPAHWPLLGLTLTDIAVHQALKARWTDFELNFISYFKAALQCQQDVIRSEPKFFSIYKASHHQRYRANNISNHVSQGWRSRGGGCPLWDHLSFKLRRVTKLLLKQLRLRLFRYHSVRLAPPLQNPGSATVSGPKVEVVEFWSDRSRVTKSWLS